MANGEDQSQANSFVLKLLEIVFTDRRRKRSFNPPSLIPAIRWATTIKTLVVGITNNLSVIEHVEHAIAKCAQFVHATRILKSHGCHLIAFTPYIVR